MTETDHSRIEEARQRLVRELVQPGNVVRIFPGEGGESQIGHVTMIDYERDGAFVNRPTKGQAFFTFSEFRYVAGMWEVVW